MKSVTAAYAKIHLPELLRKVRQGERFTISHYNKPVAELVPSEQVKSIRRLGTLNGKFRILDPHCFDPMTDQEVDAFLGGRHH